MFLWDVIEVPFDRCIIVWPTVFLVGDPKGIQHPTGGHAVVNRWTMKALYGMEWVILLWRKVWVKKLKASLLSVYRLGDTWWAASDLGWVVGHEYICYSPLLAGLTTVVYEGKPVGTPDAGQFFRSAEFFRRKWIMNDCWLYFRVISEYDVNGFFTTPTALRAIKMADPQTLEGSKYPIKR